jgi:hypothetical protein
MFTTRGTDLEVTASHTDTESISLEAPIRAAPSLPSTADGKNIPQTHPSMDPPAGKASSSSRPQRKRKREVGAEDGKEAGAHKRPRKARIEGLPEGQRRDAREGGQNEHEQAPAQPQLRRSTRIQAMNKRRDTVPPQGEIPARSTSRKRAVGKK